jgi:hypothetical protein
VATPIANLVRSPITAEVTSQSLIAKSFDRPDAVWPLPGGARLEVLRLGALDLARGTAPPGWRWTTHVGPEASTDLCETAHVGIVLSGTEAIRMADGTELELHAGDAFAVGPGHDAWVVGDEPCVSLDFLVSG